MSQSRLDRLGFDTQFATDEQLAALESLSDAEIELLVRIKGKLDDASGDVEGHSVEAGGVVW
ncbi:aroma-sacti cluster domain-containing protein [Catellatospora sp. TT07R-123]|uniref:aroma-sacti cluster domain-containing protein n=1 Tax=Catellatospora sp. TT07R-123 TaxID=2733863 RepID=UPI001BB41FA6|nr:aroma-sacti cluster domain-containing protein [Catellatospora sp. TT07R-123]